jgi:autotransporter translocation and assembly factor TamB
MDVRLLRLLAAAPLVVLLGAVMALAAAPDGHVTARDREVVARLTRGGAPRFDAEGSHGVPDGVEAADVSAPSPALATAPGHMLTAAAPDLPPRADVITMLDIPAVGQRAGRPSAPPARGRAPPRR